jgi:GNAT superfamily N-acetyltransferase
LLGLSAAEWRAPGGTVIAHAAALADYRGIYAVRRLETVVVSVPAPLVEDTIAGLANCEASGAMDASVVSPIYGDAVERVIGPAWIGYADTTDFHPADTHGARRLEDSDHAMLRALSAACSTEDWEHSGVAFDRAPIFGCFARDSLVAACSYEPWGQHLLHVGVVTHPDHRGKGLGRAVASAATGHGLAADAAGFPLPAGGRARPHAHLADRSCQVSGRYDVPAPSIER